MYLYPRITLAAARALVDTLADQPAEDLRRAHSDEDTLIDPYRSFFAPTGGARVDGRILNNLRHTVRDLVDQLGFPEPASTAATAQFDTDCAILLYEQMKITPAEASALEVWAHMTTVMMPDIVRWRYSSERSPQDRFIGGGRGVRKNTFGRLWWRAHLFRLASNSDDPYMLLKMLGEDDHVQITERPTIAGNPVLAQQIALALHDTWLTLKSTGMPIPFSERDLLRDSLKRIRRRLSITAFDLLDEAMLKSTIDEIFISAVTVLYSTSSSTN